MFYLKGDEGLSEAEKDLKSLKEQLHDDQPVGPLIGKCRTLDQVMNIFSLKTFLQFLN